MNETNPTSTCDIGSQESESLGLGLKVITMDTTCYVMDPICYIVRRLNKLIYIVKVGDVRITVH